MGIRKLTSIVNDNVSSLKTIVDIENSTVVVDGNSFFVTLLAKEPFQYGGSYRDLYNCFYDHLYRLKQCGINIYIIFDGGYVDTKISTWLSRKHAQIKNVRLLYEGKKMFRGSLPKPPLYLEIAIEALENLAITFSFAEKEADALTAHIANKLGGFVVAEDSDYFVFDVVKGTISVADIAKVTIGNTMIPVFQRKRLASLLQTSEEKLTLLPVIMGCDYSDQELLRMFQHILCIDVRNHTTSFLNALREVFKLSLEQLTELLSKGGTLLNQVMAEIEKVYNEYDLKNVKEEGERCLKIMSSSGDTSHARCTSSMTDKEKMSYGLIQSGISDTHHTRIKLCNLQLEDPSQLTSTYLTAQLRRRIYGFLFKNTQYDIVVIEYIRKGDKVEKEEIHSKTFIYPPKITNKKESINYLYRILQSDQLNLKNLNEHIYFTLATQYWIKKCRNMSVMLTKFHINALILSYARLQNDFQSKEKYILRDVGNPTFDGDLTHVGSCWQEIAREIMFIIKLLDDPIDVPPVHKMYDGRLLHETYWGFEQGKRMESAFGRDIEALFRALSNALLSAVDSKSQVRGRKQNGPNIKSTKRPSETSSSWRNQFSVTTGPKD